MADATRARGPAAKPARGGYARKVKANAASISGAKNQQSSSPYSSSTATVLPRIDRRGVDAPEPKSEVVVSHRPIASPQERDLVSVPISVPIPPRRPSSKGSTAASMENSPTYHGDDLDGPSAKAAWCTPRSPTPTDVDRPHLTAFFAPIVESNASDSVSDALATPTRLKSVEETLAATEALYAVDLDQLEADNDKFFEIATSAHQHVEVMQSELPSLADSFQHTRNALSDLCGDIATLHQQHEEAQQRMLEQLASNVDANADEMVALTEAHAAEKTQLTDKHLQEMHDTCAAFEEKLEDLEKKLSDTEASYQEQLDQLRASSKAQLEELRSSTEAELVTTRETAQAELEALEKLSGLKLEALQTSSREHLDRREKELQDQLVRRETDLLEQLERRERELQKELQALRASSTAAYEDLHSSSTSAYEKLKTSLEAEIAELRRSSQEELATVRSTLTGELEALQRDSTVEITGLKSKATQDLEALRCQKEEEVERVRSTLTAECSRVNQEAADEKTRLNKLKEEQLSQLEERRAQETSMLSAELHEARVAHSRDVTDLHAQYKSWIASMEETYATEAAEAKAAHIAQVNDVVRKADAKLSETVTRYEDKLRSMSDTHDTEMKRTTQQAALERESLVTKYEQQVAEAEEDRRRERETLILGYETDMESLKRTTREQLEQSTKAHESYVSQLRESHAAKVLSLETSLRDQETQFKEQLAARTVELEQYEKCVCDLEASREALRVDFRNFSERASQEIARKEMDTSQQEAFVLRLDEELRRMLTLLEDSQRKLKLAEDDRQVKAGTILELTFVIKSRDDEIDKLRNSLLDSMKTANTKSEILEMTAETLSSKAKELEDTRAALRLESGRLTIVEESMHQKEGMLEDTTLKVESMRLNMENMRLEMKRMQMDMKLQLEHTEGEMELKNGEIRRLHGAISELKLKNDFGQQTIERLEESLGIANRQVDEAQRRINLLKLEATNSADELKKTSDLLCDKESALLVSSQEKQALSSERSRLRIQINNLAMLSQHLREEAQCYAMHTEEIHANYQIALEKAIAEKDERLRAEKHLLMLELNASKDMVSYLEGVEERYKTTSNELETHKAQRTALDIELIALRDSATRMEEDLQGCQVKIREQESVISELNDAAEASKTRYATQLELEHRRISDLHVTVGDGGEKLQQAMSSVLQLEREKKQLQDDLGRATRDHEFLVESINEEKTGIFETMLSLKKDLGDCEQKLQQVQSERERLQQVSTATQTQLDQVLEDLARTRRELTDRCNKCDRLNNSVETLNTTCTDIEAKREQELAAHANVCREYEAAAAIKDNELIATAQTLKECLEETNLLREDRLSSIRETVEKAEAAIRAVELDLKRMEKESSKALLQMQQANEETVRRLENEKAQALQRAREEMNDAVQQVRSDMTEALERAQTEKSEALERIQVELNELNEAMRLQQAEKNEAVRLAEEERLELVRLTNEEKLAILRQAEEEKREIVLERQLRETASRNHRAQERERLRRLAKYEQERLMELNESAQMLAEEQQTRLLAELHRTKDENATLMVEYCLTDAAAKLQLVHEQEKLRKMAHDERIRLLELNEASRMVAEEHRARLLDKEVERQRLMDDEQTARLLEQHAREQMAKEEECILLLERHKHVQMTIAQQRERFSEQHERFFMWNAEHETRLLASHLADVEALQDGLMEEKSKLAAELVDVKRALDERAAKAEADRREWESAQSRTLRTTAERHQAELDTSIQTVREENARLREKHREEVEALVKNFEHTAEVIRLRAAQEHLIKINEMLETSRAEEERHAKMIEGINQALEEKSAELAAAARHLGDQDRAMRELEATLNAKRLDTEAHLNANLLELEVHRDATQQELEIELSATEIAIAEANQVITAKTAAIDSLRKELAIVLEASKSTRSAEQLVSLVRQQVETYLLEHHRVCLADLSEVSLDSEQGVLECMKDYFAMRCRSRSGTSQDSDRPVLRTVDDVCHRLQDYDRVSSLLRGESVASDGLKVSSDDSASDAVKVLQRNFVLLRASVHELVTGASGDDDTTCTDVDTLIGSIGSLRGFFNKLQLSTPSESERASRLTEVVHVVEQHERLMQAISTSTERDEVHSVDDVCAHFDKLEKMLARSREVTESDEFSCLADLERILDECELHRRQVGQFKLGALSCQVESNSGKAVIGQMTNFVGAADVASVMRNFETFITDCWSALELGDLRSDDTPASTVAIIEAICELMSILQHFEMLQPQLGSPRRRGGDDSNTTSSPGKPSLRNKVAAIVAFADELKSMSEFAQGILDEECGPAADMASEVGSNMSSASLASLRTLTRTPTPTMGLADAEVHKDISSYNVDDLELNVDLNVIEADGQDGCSGEIESIPALSASPSAFMADSLLDISLVMSDHQRLLAETAHLVGKVSRQTGEPKRPLDVREEITRLVREHCALLALTRRLFKVRDARHDLPSLLECVAILQRFTQRLPLLCNQPITRSADTNSNSSASLPGEPQASGWGHALLHSSSSTSSFAGNNNGANATGASSSSSSLTSSEQVVRPPLSIFATIEEVARHLQDYDYLVQQLQKKHKEDLLAAAFTSVETLATVLSSNLDALAQAQQILGLKDATKEIPQLSSAVHEIVKLTQHLVLEPTRLTTISSDDILAKEALNGFVASSPSGVEAIQVQFKAIITTLNEFSSLVAWLRQTILQVPVMEVDDTSGDAPQAVEAVDMESISDLKQHVRDFVSQLCDLQTANSALEEELAAMQQSQQQVLHELRNESEILSRLDSSATETEQTEESSPQRRRADVLETLLSKQEAFRRQSSFQDREQQREAAFLREQGLLAGDSSDGEAESNSTSGISSTTRLAVYKRLIDGKHSLERQLQHLKNELTNTTTRHEAETLEFHRQAELVRQHDRVATVQQIDALKQTHEAETDKLKQEFETIEKRLEADKHELEQRINALTQQQHDCEARFADEKRAIEDQVVALQRSLSDANQTAAADRSALEQALNDAKTSTAAETSVLERAKYEQKLVDWKHLAQAALDEEMAFLRRSDSLAFAASKLQCFSDGSISERDEERGYSRLNVWKALVAHMDRLSDRLAAVEHRDACEYEFLRSSGLVEQAPSDDEPPLASVRTTLFQALINLRGRESILQRELEDEAAFVRFQAKMEFDESQPTASRQRVYKTLLDGQNALIEDKMERELEAARENAFLESHNLPFGSRMNALEHLVCVCEELELLKKHVDEERDLLVEQRVCTPQELRRPLRPRGSDAEVEEEVQGGEAASLGEFASIRLDVYRKLLANEQRARDDMVEKEAAWEKQIHEQQKNHEAALDSAMLELQRRHENEIGAMMHTVEQLELAIMLREDLISGLPDRLEKRQAEEKAHQRQKFDDEKQKEMAEALARWSEESEVAIAAATATATANAAALVQETHERELKRMKCECDQQIAALADTHAKQLATVASVRVDSEAQAKQQVGESVARQVAKMRAGFLERLAKRDGAAVATIYRCIRMATDVLNPSAFVTASSAVSADANAVPPSRHGSSNTSGSGGGSDKIPVAVTHSVVALVKELKALKEHVATSLDQLQVDDGESASTSAPPLSISSSFLLGGNLSSSDGSDTAMDADTPWIEGSDQVADAILSAYREVVQYSYRQLLARQEAAQDALSRLYTLILGEEAAAASLSAENHAKAVEELTQQRQERSARLALEIELTRERTAREDAECQRKLHDVCVRRLLEDQRSMEAALSKSLEASQLECKQLQTRIEQLEHYQRLAITSSSGFQSSPNAARMVTPTRGFGGGNTNSMSMPMRPERPRDHPSSSIKGGGTAHKERFVSDLEKETGQRRTTANLNGISGNSGANGDGGGTIRRRRPFPAGEMDTSSLSLSSGPSTTTATRGSLQDQELWFQGVRTLHFVSFFVSVFFVPKQSVFRVEVLNSDTEQQQTVYVPRAEMQQFVAQHERDKRRRHGYGGAVDSEQDEETQLDDPTRRGDVVDALFEHVKVYGAGTGNMLLAFE